MSAGVATVHFKVVAAAIFVVVVVVVHRSRWFAIWFVAFHQFHCLTLAFFICMAVN